MQNTVTSCHQIHHRLPVRKVCLHNLFMRGRLAKGVAVADAHDLGKMGHMLPAMPAKRTGGAGYQ